MVTHTRDTRIPALVARVRSGPAPLTFSQQGWWNVFQCLGGAEPGWRRRTVMSALRISGDLDLQCLRKSFDAVVRRHEALRTRIITVDGTPMQKVDAAQPFDLRVSLVANDPNVPVDVAAARIVTQFAAEEVDLATGPLFAATLLKLPQRGDHVLAFALHHLIADGVSIKVLLMDVWQLYAQHLRGPPASLPPQSVQLADYAEWQKQTSRLWFERHAPYWAERLTGILYFNPYEPDGGGPCTLAQFTLMPVLLDGELTKRLAATNARERNLLSMIVLTAYAASALRWQNKDQLIMAIIVNGRHRPQLRRMIGFIASTLYLRIRLREDDTFRSLLRQITREYSAAHEHYDDGRLSTSFPGPEYTRSMCFNWQTRMTGSRTHAGASETVSPMPGETAVMHPFLFEKPAYEQRYGSVGSRTLRWEPGIQLTYSIEGIEGTLYCCSDLYSPGELERLTRNFRRFAEEFVENPERRVMSISYEQ